MQPRSKSPRFYREPSDKSIQQYGPVVAEARMHMRGERISSRILSATLALLGGSALLMVNELYNGTSTQEKISYFVTPLVIQLIAQARSERVQRRDLRHIEQVASTIRAGVGELQAENQRLSQENEPLRPPTELDHQQNNENNPEM